jgi:hypothetical protein
MTRAARGALTVASGVRLDSQVERRAAPGEVSLGEDRRGPPSLGGARGSGHGHPAPFSPWAHGYGLVVRTLRFVAGRGRWSGLGCGRSILRGEREAPPCGSHHQPRPVTCGPPALLDDALLGGDRRWVLRPPEPFLMLHEAHHRFDLSHHVLRPPLPSSVEARSRVRDDVCWGSVRVLGQGGPTPALDGVRQPRHLLEDRPDLEGLVPDGRTSGRRQARGLDPLRNGSNRVLQALQDVGLLR